MTRTNSRAQVNCPPAVKSQPVLWWQLINEAEAIRAECGLGLANVWQWIHRNDYRRARNTLDRVIREYIEPLREDPFDDAEEN